MSVLGDIAEGDALRPGPPVRRGLFAMVVDVDNGRITRLLSALSSRGVVARGCESAETAGALVRSIGLPDIVFCTADMLVPVALELRASAPPSTARSGVFMVVIAQNQQEAVRALAEGADDFLLWRDLDESLDARLQATLGQATVRAWMETLQKAGEAVSAARRFDGLFSEVAARLRRIVPADHFIVALPCEPQVRLEVVDMISPSAAPWRFSLTLPASEGCPVRFSPPKAGFRICDRVRDHDSRLSAGMNTCVCLPLWNDGRLLGSLSLASRDPEAFDETVIPYLVSLGVQVAHAVANIERYEQARGEADRLGVIVREVHHRIKNNLQGVVGLLTQHRDAEPQTAPALDGAISQLHAVAEVHDLLSHHTEERVNLHDLVRGICRLNAAMCPHRIEARLRIETAILYLSASEAVPFALVLNELILNAINHGYAPGQCGTIRVTLTHGTTPRLDVANDGAPPVAHDTDTSGGLGLQLVRALLPRHGTFALKRDGDWTVAEVGLGEWMNPNANNS